MSDNSEIPSKDEIIKIWQTLTDAHGRW
jgi:hypothetical protein